MMFLLALLLNQSAFAAIKFDAGIPIRVKTDFQNDLKLLKSLRGKTPTPLHRKVFGIVQGVAYTKFFETRIKGVGLDECGGGAAVACVIPGISTQKMWITKRYMDQSRPQALRISVLLHEARHTEGENSFWSHAICPKPFLDKQGRDVVGLISGMKLEGEPACDTTPLGAYAVGAIFLKNLHKSCTNCTQKFLMDAQLFGNDSIGRITDAKAKKELIKDLGE